MSKIPPKGTPERSQWFADRARERWSKPRPAPRQRRAARAMPAGSEEEAFWDARARELGLSDEGMSRTSWRRLLLRLADADTARLAEAAEEPSPTGSDEADPLLTYLEREATRLRTRASRDRMLADAHDREAAEAEGRLVAEMRRLGLIS